jgi:hypothetical protein
MVDHLPHRPSALAVRSFDLLWRKPLHRGPESRRSLLDIADELLVLFRVRGPVISKFSDGISRIAHL